MTFRTSAVNKISESLMNDLRITMKELVEAFAKSDEINKQVNERIAYIEQLEDLVNQMGDSIETDTLESATITLNGVCFYFNKEKQCFEHGNIESSARYHVESDYGINYAFRKEDYILSRVHAIVAALDNTMDFPAIKELVYKSIDLNEIIRNKAI